jgi:hypothetical protein
MGVLGNELDCCEVRLGLDEESTCNVALLVSSFFLDILIFSLSLVTEGDPPFAIVDVFVPLVVWEL